MTNAGQSKLKVLEKERICSALLSPILLRGNGSYLEVKFNCSYNITNPAVLYARAFVVNDPVESHLEEECLQQDCLGAMWREVTWRQQEEQQKEQERRGSLVLLPIVLWSSGSYLKVKCDCSYNVINPVALYVQAFVANTPVEGKGSHGEERHLGAAGEPNRPAGLIWLTGLLEPVGVSRGNRRTFRPARLLGPAAKGAAEGAGKEEQVPAALIFAMGWWAQYLGKN